MSAMSPLVTVLMCVRNGERFLKAALASISEQSFKDFEFLVIDDGSTDGTAAMLRSWQDPRLRVQRQEPLGLTRSLNRGLGSLRTPYVARMDADDVSHPERLARQVDLMQGNAGIALSGTWATYVDEAGRPVGSARPPLDHETIGAQLLWDNAFCHPSMIFRSEAIRALGGYDEAFERSQDYDLAWRVQRAARVANLPMPLLSWRLNPMAVSARHRGAQRRSAGEISYRALSECIAGGIDEGWFWRTRSVWTGERTRLDPGDGTRLAQIISEMPVAAGRTTWVELISIVAAARREEAPQVLAAAWRRFPDARRRLFHPKRVLRVALGPSGLRLSRKLRARLYGY